MEEGGCLKGKSGLGSRTRRSQGRGCERVLLEGSLLGDESRQGRRGGALWTQRVTRLLAVALSVSGKHATLNSTFWQDPYIFEYLRRIKYSFKNMSLYYPLKILLKKDY
jgi:hypothetical protein